MKNLFFILALAGMMACQNPELEPTLQSGVVETKQPADKRTLEEVVPLSPVPENAQELHELKYFPGPAPRFPGGYWVPPIGKEPIFTRPDPTKFEFLQFMAGSENAWTGEWVTLTAMLNIPVGASAARIKVELDLGPEFEKRFVSMYNNGVDGDERASDGLFTYKFQIPRDTHSVNSNFIATAMLDGEILKIRKCLLTIRGGDFKIYTGFESKEKQEGQDLPSNPQDFLKVRGVNLKEACWTIYGGWTGNDGALEEDSGVFLTEKDAVLISPWIASGSKLWFTAHQPVSGASKVLELSMSRDGLNWEPLDFTFTAREGNKTGKVFDAILSAEFHGFIRWKMKQPGSLMIDQVRLLQRRD